MRKLWVIFAMLLCISILNIHGQELHHEFIAKSYNINTGGMLVLGTWAVGNITTGAIGWSRTSDQRMYFHQMNLFWNVVNLSIAGAGLYGSLATDFSLWTMDEALDRQLRIQRLFLINAGLDIAYMGTGYVLTRIAPNYPMNQHRLTGYGNSIMIQGGFLFVFDLVMYGIQRAQRGSFLENISLGSMQDAMGISVLITL